MMQGSGYTTDQQIEEMHEEIRRAKQKMEKLIPKSDTDPKELTSKMLPKNRVSKTISNILFGFLVVILSTVLISVLVVRSQGQIPSLFGYQLFVIESGSMEPSLNIGSIIFSQKPAEPDQLEVGDIVTFKTTTGVTVTHRIVQIIRSENDSISYQTKGDNPINSPDQELLTPDRVIAVLIMKIPLT